MTIPSREEMDSLFHIATIERERMVDELQNFTMGFDCQFCVHFSS
jgi:hypothetical protein